MIQRLNSYNLLTDKVTKKVPYTIYRPDDKNKKSIGESLKPSNINVASVSVHVK